ncbi:uncharacterized protein EI90DRAFT_844652 [Cantharellus anzutake]|uniref:uncharacterized protein n=1 Tax=Cantharellus anzutake TaxID=1750568 RepID=UPI0019044F81|nr:uncharacterized protein EI90DRAFT_844652 [Cantharellus anzutake]KAF8332295.1 hypothetical protein EI90DRAFT_844652 [Cantharellus anzutake]
MAQVAVPLIKYFILAEPLKCPRVGCRIISTTLMLVTLALDRQSRISTPVLPTVVDIAGQFEIRAGGKLIRVTARFNPLRDIGDCNGKEDACIAASACSGLFIISAGAISIAKLQTLSHKLSCLTICSPTELAPLSSVQSQEMGMLRLFSTLRLPFLVLICIYALEKVASFSKSSLTPGMPHCLLLDCHISE